MTAEPVNTLVNDDGRYDDLPPTPWRILRYGWGQNSAAVIVDVDGRYVTSVDSRPIAEFVVAASRRLTVVSEREAALLRFMTTPVDAP